MLKIFLVLTLQLIFANCINGIEDTNYDFFADNSVKLLDSDKYILKVAEQFISELEEYGVCNTQLQNVTQNISRLNYFGLDVVGSVYYRNGFLNTFQEVNAKETQSASIDQEKNSASMFVNLIFSSLMMFYDYTADLSDIKFSGTVAIPMKNFEIRLSLTKFFGNDTISHNVEVTATQLGRTTRWDFQPSNHYTEIINKDILLSFDESEKNIENLWNALLGKAINKIPFPELCLMC